LCIGATASHDGRDELEHAGLVVGPDHIVGCTESNGCTGVFTDFGVSPVVLNVIGASARGGHHHNDDDDVIRLLLPPGRRAVALRKIAPQGD
jgi:hypothetical protein